MIRYIIIRNIISIIPPRKVPFHMSKSMSCQLKGGSAHSLNFITCNGCKKNFLNWTNSPINYWRCVECVLRNEESPQTSEEPLSQMRDCDSSDVSTLTSDGSISQMEDCASSEESTLTPEVSLYQMRDCISCKEPFKSFEGKHLCEVCSFFDYDDISFQFPHHNVNVEIKKLDDIPSNNMEEIYCNEECLKENERKQSFI